MNAEQKSRQSWIAAAVLGGTFALGCLTGAGLMWWGRSHALPRRPPPGILPLDQLQLTPDQHSKVSALFEQYHPRLDAIFRSTFPEVQAIHESLEGDIRKVLTPAQRSRLDALEASRPPFPPTAGPWHGRPGPDRDRAPPGPP
jgi:Spy/CpxP family protein refolding chaperone